MLANTPPVEANTRWNLNRPRVVGVIFGVILGLIILNTVAVGVVSHSNCTRVTQLENVIVQQGERGLKTLGKPGGTAFAYYQAHPKELATAQENLREEIKLFTPKACTFPLS